MVRLSGKPTRKIPGLVREMLGLPTPVFRPVLNATGESTRGRAWLGRGRWNLDTWERQVESQRNDFRPTPVFPAGSYPLQRGKLHIRGDVSLSPASRVDEDLNMRTRTVEIPMRRCEVLPSQILYQYTGGTVVVSRKNIMIRPAT